MAMALHTLMLLLREGGDFCCTFAPALLAWPLQCMLGLLYSRGEGLAPMRMETTALGLKALNNSTLARPLLVVSDRDTMQTS